MSAFLLHLRNSPIRWAVPALVILDLAILFLRNLYWIGVWPDTGAAAQVPVYLLGPLLAGAAAWSAAAPDRHRIAEQIRAARVHPAMSEAYRLGATSLLLGMPYLVGQVVAVVVTGWNPVPGFGLWAGYFALGWFVTLLTIVLGWIVGKSFRSIFAALAAALGCLVLLSLLDRRLGSIVVSGDPEVMVDPSAIAPRLVLVVALLAAVLWLPSYGASKIGRRGMIAPVVVLVPLIAVMANTRVITDRESPGRNVICVGDAIDLCIWPEHKKYVPMLREIDARVSALPQVFLLPARMNQFGMDRNDFIDDRGREVYIERAGLPPTFYVIEGSVWSSAGDIAGAIMSTTFEYQNAACRWASQADPDAVRLSALSAWLETYLAGGGMPDYRSDAPGAVQRAWAHGRGWANEKPIAAQFAWAAREVTDLHGRYCP